MTRPKIRTFIAILAAAVAVAAVLAPVASAGPVPNTGVGDTLVTQTTTTSTGTIARPNDGRYSKSGEAKRRQQLCADLGLIFEGAMEDYEYNSMMSDLALEKGYYDDAIHYGNLAQQALDTGSKAADDSRNACRS